MGVQTPPLAGTPDHGVDAGVIEDARKRQRRYRRLGAAVAALAALVAVGLIVGFAGGERGPRRAGSMPPRQSGAGTIKSPTAVFAQDPYMGVSCRTPNYIGCDRVGLAVWLRQPATVTAAIAGAPLKLNAPRWSYVTRDSHGPLYVYAGFLQPAGLRTRLGVSPESRPTNSWLGANAPSPLVRFRIDYGDGNIVSTQEHVYLSAGWG